MRRRKPADIVVPDNDETAAETSESASSPSGPVTDGPKASVQLLTQPGMGAMLTVTHSEQEAATSGTRPEGPVRIGDMMVARGLITPQQLDYALAERVNTGQRLGSELVRLGMVTERQLMEALAEQLRVARCRPSPHRARILLPSSDFPRRWRDGSRRYRCA